MFFMKEKKLKKLVGMAMAAVMLALSMAVLTGGRIPVKAENEFPEPVLYYDFENEADNKSITDKAGDNHPTLTGSALIEYNEECASNVLNLKGRGSAHVQFPLGFFDGRDQMTISMDIYSKMGSENFFTFAIGKDTNQYLFLRTRAGEWRCAITNGSWGAEDDVATSDVNNGLRYKWTNVTIVLDDDVMRLYMNGECVDEQTGLRAVISDFGEDVIGYLGKSFYDGDRYFNGLIDNVKVFDTVLTDSQIAIMSGAELTPFYDVTGQGVVAWTADKENKALTVYAAKSAGAQENGVVVSFKSQDYASLETGGDLQVAYGQENEVSFTMNTGDEVRSEGWTVTAVLCDNPVLSGQYADPDIDVFGDTYYLYCTTDGFAGWAGTQFHCFSSKNLVDWTDEGVIIDVSKSGNVPWSTSCAWAPTIEEKNGQYYFYFCAKDETGESMIGVAVADHPAGPYTAMETPLMTVAMCREQGVSMGQAIDPSIFTDDDGTSYMLFGNGAAAVVKLNDDMVSCDLETLDNYYGAQEFREAITVTKRDGIYHFTWSCDDTGSPNYHVNYGTSDSIYGPIDFQYTVLSKNDALDILGTGHHSILQIPGEDEYYVAYHRFFTPIGFFSDGTGHHRQTCIDKVTFGADGLMEVITPTLEGVAPRVLPEKELPKPEPTAEPTEVPADPTEAPGDSEVTAERTEMGLVFVVAVAVVAVVVVVALAVVAVMIVKKKK